MYTQSQCILVRIFEAYNIYKKRLTDFHYDKLIWKDSITFISYNTVLQ